MNYLTLNFLKACYKTASDKPIVKHRLQQELESVARCELSKEFDDSTVFLSPSGKNFQNRLHNWIIDLKQTEVEQCDLLYSQLLDLKYEAQSLHQETLFSLSCPGAVDYRKVHILYYDEQNEAAKRILDLIIIDMYRIVVTAGVNSLKQLPLLKYIHPGIKDYYTYYSQYISSAMLLLDHRKQYGIWAYQFKDQSRFGNLARLPTFLPVAVKHNAKKQLVLGEHVLTGTGTNYQVQGIGNFTNISPSSIEKAQERGIHDTLSLSQLINRNFFDDPKTILNEIFENEYYAISPDEYYSKLSLAVFHKTLNSRHIGNKCLLCGSGEAIPMICLNCISKAKQRL